MTIAIFALLTDFGILEWTTSLSNTIPLINEVSPIEAPGFLSILILAKSIFVSSSLSEINNSASTTIFDNSFASSATSLLIILVDAIFINTSLLLLSTFIAIFFNISRACSAALAYPSITIVGCTSLSISSWAFSNNAPDNTTDVVVPSPTSLSVVFATSTIIFPAGCCISISFKIVAPSFVIVTSPKPSTSILSIPRGPNDVLTNCATSVAANMLFFCASFPLVSLEPSFKIKTGWPLLLLDIYNHIFVSKTMFLTFSLILET